jgi:hypothetical protein
MNKLFKCSLITTALCAVFAFRSAIPAAGQSESTLAASPASSSDATRKGAKTTQVPEASRAELDEFEKRVADQYQAQQIRIEKLQEENQFLLQQLKTTADKLSIAEHRIDLLAKENSPDIAPLQVAVAAVRTAETTSHINIERPQHQSNSENPVSLRYKGVSILPGGFFAAEALVRSRAENSDINTSWAGIPFTSQTMAHLTEFRATSRQTRLSLRADSSIGNSAVTAYFETDFLGSGFGASEVQTNGFSNRVRQMWSRVQFPTGWVFAAGQMWSLITTNRVGIENLTEMSPMVIDGSNFIGYDYARQTGFRLTRRFHDNKVSAAFSVENAAMVALIPANVPSSIVANLSGISTTGTGALSNTTYSTNLGPDLLAKVAVDPAFGHYELKAIGRTFRDRLNSTPTSPGHNSTLLAGAIGGAAYLPLGNTKINLLAQAMWGAVGRYGATGTDVIVKPDGSLSAEKSAHAIVGADWHPTPRMDVYAYASNEYLPRNYGYGLATVDNRKCFVETGFSCFANVHNLKGAAAGVWYRLYKGPAGTIQYGFGYIYIEKSTWAALGGAPFAIENIGETSFRYYLP